MTSAASANKAAVRLLVAEGDKVVGRVRRRPAAASSGSTSSPSSRLPDDADPGSSGRRKDWWLGRSNHSRQRHPHAAIRRPGTPPAPPPAGPVAPRLRQPATVALGWVESDRPPQKGQLDSVFLTERGTPVNPNHASRAFARLAASVGLVAHPHMLRLALASAMAAEKEPASIIAAQLRHATAPSPSGSTSTSPYRASAGRMIEVCSAQRRGMDGRCRRRVGRRETGGKSDPRTRPEPRADGRVSAA
jgi:hypothetical protein